MVYYFRGLCQGFNCAALNYPWPTDLAAGRLHNVTIYDKKSMLCARKMSLLLNADPFIKWPKTVKSTNTINSTNAKLP